MVYKITDEADRPYIEEFRNNPIAPNHSPGLQRLLNVMRLYRGGDQYILIARREFDDYVIGRMPPLRDDPIVIEDDVVFEKSRSRRVGTILPQVATAHRRDHQRTYEDKTA